MTAETKKLVRDLRSYARKYKDGSTLGRAIIETEDIMFAAAKAIESLAEVAEKASARAAMCDTVMDEAAKMKLELDAVKKRAQAAEKDLHMLRQCLTCTHDGSDGTACETCFDDSQGTALENWKWRGICAENGGSEG